MINKMPKLSTLEKVQRIQEKFVNGGGIEVQAFVHSGEKIPDPTNANHLWLLEPDYVFSVWTYGLEERLIVRGTDAKGKVTLTGGFYLWRVPADEEIVELLRGLEEIK